MSKVRLLTDFTTGFDLESHFSAGHIFKVVGNDSRGVIVEYRIKGDKKQSTFAFKHQNEYWELIDE